MENIIKAFIQFVQNLDKENGLAVLCFDNENIRNIAPQLDRRYISYALEHEADYTAADIVADGPQTTFTVVYKGEKPRRRYTQYSGQTQCAECTGNDCRMS